MHTPILRPVVLLLSVVVLFHCSMVRAALIAYDSFDSATYPLGETLNGKNGGTGFANPYFVSAALGTAAPGLSFGNMPTSGNAARLNFLPNYLANLSRTVAALPAQGETLWFSMLFQQLDAGESASGGTYFTGLRGDERLANVNVSFGPFGAPDNFNLNAVAFAGQGTPIVDYKSFTIDHSAPSLLVMKLSDIGMGSEANPQELSVWALSEANYASLTFSTLTESDLDLHSAGKVSLLAPFPIIPGDADGIEFGFVMFARDVVFDEFRMGTGLGDVVPSAVPEPEAMLPVAGVLLGFGLWHRARTRRRNKPTS